MNIKQKAKKTLDNDDSVHLNCGVVLQVYKQLPKLWKLHNFKICAVYST